MREIKFRAWDKKNNWIIPWNELKHLSCEEQFSLFEDENFVFQQYTNLKDKNGVEIYEGDCFNCIYHRDGHTNHHYYIIFNEFSGAFEYQRVGVPCTQTEVRQGIRDGARGVIIGNIYQNPELLAK